MIFTEFVSAPLQESHCRGFRATVPPRHTRGSRHPFGDQKHAALPHVHQLFARGRRIRAETGKRPPRSGRQRLAGPVGHPPWRRWDRAVETALETCGRLLVILSSTSANSENVQDEIGVAFDNNKPIVPIFSEV